MKRSFRPTIYAQAAVLAVMLASSAAVASANGGGPATPNFQGTFSLFDAAQNVVGGLFPGITAVDLTSVPCNLTGPPNTTIGNCAPPAAAPPYNVTDSGITWTPAKNHAPTLSQLKTLSAAYNVDATDCGGGSPRFLIVLSGGSFLTGYFGPPPSFTGCPVGWQNTGNFVDPSDPTARWAVGNSGAYQPYATASAGLGGQQITEIDIVVDGGWFPALNPPASTHAGQDVTIDNFTVNNQVMHLPLPANF